MPTIALVDDDRNILTSLRMLLEAEGYKIVAYTDGVSAFDGIAGDPPDLAILDIKMPRMDGMELLRRLRQKTEMPVIFLTSKDAQQLLEFANDADVVLFGSGSRTFEMVNDPAVMSRLKLDPERHTCIWDSKQVTLTVTEFLILQALAQRPGVVKSRDALMDAAYDDQVYVDDRTIDSHIKRLRKKFKVVDNNFDVIETLYGVGYRFKE